MQWQGLQKCLNVSYRGQARPEVSTQAAKISNWPVPGSATAESGESRWGKKKKKTPCKWGRLTSGCQSVTGHQRGEKQRAERCFYGAIRSRGHLSFIYSHQQYEQDNIQHMIQMILWATVHPHQLFTMNTVFFCALQVNRLLCILNISCDN